MNSTRAFSRRTKAVVVDDSVTMRMFLRRSLEALDFEVLEFDDGESCLASFPFDEPPAVTFVDLHMPGMSGMEVITFLRGDDRSQDLFLVMVSTDESASARAGALDLGADAFMGKPLQVSALRSGLERLGFSWTTGR